jgi:hypothetical protein
LLSAAEVVAAMEVWVMVDTVGMVGMVDTVEEVMVVDMVTTVMVMVDTATVTVTGMDTAVDMDMAVVESIDWTAHVIFARRIANYIK